jgi:cytochrome o ubiquinol oxidase operon protein cyoD
VDLYLYDRIFEGIRMSTPQPERGRTRAYIIGFVLSLVFSLIPYYLVVNHRLAGSALLGTIIGFAVVQMIIQITFFLGIGRGPKPNWQLYFFISTVGIILAVVGGSILIVNNLHYNMQPSDQTKKLINDEGIYQVGGELTGACQGQHANHQVTIDRSQASLVHTKARKCDTLTFISGDGKPHQITFGVYPQHLTYAGETKLAIQKGYNQTITLSESGVYQFYDALQAQARGDFTVSE